jgi:hypothetical protein
MFDQLRAQLREKAAVKKPIDDSKQRKKGGSVLSGLDIDEDSDVPFVEQAMIA